MDTIRRAASFTQRVPKNTFSHQAHGRKPSVNKTSRYFRKTGVLQPPASNNFRASLGPASRASKTQAPEQVFFRFGRMTLSKVVAQPHPMQANGRERRLENPHIAETSQELPAPARAPRTCSPAQRGDFPQWQANSPPPRPSSQRPRPCMARRPFTLGRRAYHPHAHALIPAVQHSAAAFRSGNQVRRPHARTLRACLFPVALRGGGPASID